jgi:hypothetical protein
MRKAGVLLCVCAGLSQIASAQLQAASAVGAADAPDVTLTAAANNSGTTPLPNADLGPERRSRDAVSDTA